VSGKTIKSGSYRYSYSILRPVYPEKRNVFGLPAFFVTFLAAAKNATIRKRGIWISGH